MKRTFSALVISGALLCTLAVPGMAAEAEGQPGDSAAASAPQAQTLPASSAVLWTSDPGRSG